MRKPTPGRLPDYVFRYLTPGPVPTPIHYDEPVNNKCINTYPLHKTDPVPKKISWFRQFINWIKKLWQ